MTRQNGQKQIQTQIVPFSRILAGGYKNGRFKKLAQVQIWHRPDESDLILNPTSGWVWLLMALEFRFLNRMIQ